MSKFNELSDKELRNLMWQKSKEWRDNTKTVEETSSLLYRYKIKGTEIWSTLHGLKTEIGKRKGTGCPGIGKISSYELRCLARNFRYPFYNLEHLYQQRCYYCKLTKSQARAAKMFNKILKNKNLIPT